MSQALGKALPIWDIHAEIIDTLEVQNCLVLGAPTGSGKSTQVPQIILDDVLCGERRVVVLQPRRVAARSLARRVAWERDTALGQGVGYQVRFENHTGPKTKIEFITEGVLLRRLHDDPELTGVGAVLFDEFHERNLMSDLALGLVKKLQRTSRDDLKIVVMSATIKTGSVSRYLGQAPDAPCPVLTSDGRTFPVEIRFGQYRNRDPVTEQAADAVELILRNDSPGDILIFMPGMGEIRGTIGALSRRRLAEPVELIPLHGELPPADQDRAFGECNRRKVVVATNVAETSVTIDGIRHVIDSGLARVARFDSDVALARCSLRRSAAPLLTNAQAAQVAPHPAPATGSGPRAVTSTGPSTIPQKFTEPTLPRRCSCCTPPASNARWISTGSTNRSRPLLKLPKIYCAHSVPWPSAWPSAAAG